jgi:hypothetical protein
MYDMYSEYEITTFCIKRLGGESEFNIYEDEENAFSNG